MKGIDKNNPINQDSSSKKSEKKANDQQKNQKNFFAQDQINVSFDPFGPFKNFNSHSIQNMFSGYDGFSSQASCDEERYKQVNFAFNAVQDMFKDLAPIHQRVNNEINGRDDFVNFIDDKQKADCEFGIQAAKEAIADHMKISELISKMTSDINHDDHEDITSLDGDTDSDDDLYCDELVWLSESKGEISELDECLEKLSTSMKNDGIKKADKEYPVLEDLTLEDNESIDINQKIETLLNILSIGLPQTSILKGFSWISKLSKFKGNKFLDSINNLGLKPIYSKINKIDDELKKLPDTSVFRKAYEKVLDSVTNLEKYKSAKVESGFKWEVKSHKEANKIGTHNKFGKICRDPKQRIRNKSIYWSKDTACHYNPQLGNEPPAYKLFERNDNQLRWIADIDKFGNVVDKHKSQRGMDINMKEINWIK